MEENEINRILNNMAQGKPLDYDSTQDTQNSQNTETSQTKQFEDFEWNIEPENTHSPIDDKEYECEDPMKEYLMQKSEEEAKIADALNAKFHAENPDFKPKDEEFWSEGVIDARGGYDSLEPEDLVSMQDDPFGDDKLPDEFDMPEIGKFMYDDYIGRIPFSRNMPKSIYSEIFALEILRKLTDLKNTKLNYKTQLKNTREAIAFISKYDFYSDNEIDLNEILHFMKVRGFAIKDYKFVDLKDNKFKPDTSDYDLYQIPADYSLEGIPSDVSERDLQDAKNLIALSQKYTDLKKKGYVSNEGRFILDDMRPITEADKSFRIRNLQWNSDADVEVWAGRMQVIKRQVDSREEHLKKHPRKVEDEYPKPNTKNYVETPHPHDQRFVMIDGKIAHAEVPKDSPYYPRWKDDDEHTIDEVWKLEADFASEIIALEEEIKELKRQHKDRREWYIDQGVNVKAVERSIRRIKRDKKRTPQEQRAEDEIYERLSQNTNLLERLNMLSA